ncbi:uncharacterized protein LOC144771942 [Lissotriton helveticus]
MGITVQNVTDSTALIIWPIIYGCSDSFYSLMYRPNWNSMLSAHSRNDFLKEERVPGKRTSFTIENLTPLTTYIMCVTCQSQNPTSNQCQVFDTLPLDPASANNKKKELALGIWLTSSILILLIACIVVYGCLHLWWRKRRHNSEEPNASSEQDKEMRMKSKENTSHNRDNRNHEDTSHSRDNRNLEDTSHSGDNRNHEDNSYSRDNRNHEDTAHSSDTYNPEDTSHSIDNRNQEDTLYSRDNRNHEDTSYSRDNRNHEGTSYSRDNRNHEDTSYSRDNRNHEGTSYSRDNRTHEDTSYNTDNHNQPVLNNKEYYVEQTQLAMIENTPTDVEGGTLNSDYQERVPTPEEAVSEL